MDSAEVFEEFSKIIFQLVFHVVKFLFEATSSIFVELNLSADFLFHSFYVVL